MLQDTATIIRRVVERDDLLHLAYDVADAVSIVREWHRLGRTVYVGEGLLAKALELHLHAARRETQRGSIARADHYESAASILEFCGLPGMSMYLPKQQGPVPDDPVSLYEKALQLSCTDLGKDRWRHVKIEAKQTRALRLSGAHVGALLNAERPDAFFNATGAGPVRGEFHFQWCAAALTGERDHIDGTAERRRTWVADGTAAYRRLKQFWQDDGGHGGMRGDDDEFWTSHGETRSRFELACVLTDLASGVSDVEPLVRRLTDARRLAERKSPQARVDDRIAGYSLEEVGAAADSLSVSLAMVEVLLSRPGRRSSHPAVETVIEYAIGVLESLRLGRHIIARSRGPFAIVLRRVLGDIALILSDLPGERAAELGLHIALVVKHSGIAAIMRSRANDLGHRIGGLVENVLSAERKLAPQWQPVMNGDDARIAANREANGYLRALEAISPVLAGWVLPDKIDTAVVLRRLYGRSGAYVLDFVGLGRTDSASTEWFRTLITPDGGVEFERVPIGAAFARFFDAQTPRVRTLRAEWLSQVNGSEDDWFELGRELLPPTLSAHLARSGDDVPVDLLISPHGSLNLLPWQALRLRPGGSRLITRATVTLSPVLTAVTHDPLPAVGEPALVHLVRRGSVSEEEPLVLRRQQGVWGLESDADVVRGRCRLHPPGTEHVPGLLQDVLDDCCLVHISAHGAGKQLEQRVFLPEVFHSHQAMQTNWPKSVILAACYLGDDSDEIDEEPLGFATAVLIGGARCVVATRTSVDSDATDEVMSRVVAVLRDNPDLDLSHALRNAQLAAIRDDDHDHDVYRWAMFSAFVN